MAPANTANLTRDTTTDQKTLPRAHQSAPRARHQTDVVFPPKRDSGASTQSDRIALAVRVLYTRASPYDTMMGQ